MSYAVIKTGGKQYRVAVGDKVNIEKLDGEQGASVTFGEVLVSGQGDSIKVGAPFISGGSVIGEIVKQFRAPKVTAFKFRRRKGYHKTTGHRQHLTQVKITGINA